MGNSKIFKRLVISHTDDFQTNENDKIKNWIESHGGTYSKDITEDVTHLLASKKAWKRLSDMVRTARRTRRIKIVSLDWLKDCLMGSKPKRLDEAGYYYEQTKLKNIKRSRKLAETTSSIDTKTVSNAVLKEKKIQAAAIAFDRAHIALQKEMSRAGFHPYTSTSGVTYIVNLVRRNILRNHLEKHRLQVGYPAPSQTCQIVTGEQSTIWRFPPSYGFACWPVVASRVRTKTLRTASVRICEPWAQCLQLYESDTTPHTYVGYTQYTKSGSEPVATDTLVPMGSTWDLAWAMFVKIFEKKTARKWSEAVRHGSYNINLDGTENDDIWQHESLAQFAQDVAQEGDDDNPTQAVIKHIGLERQEKVVDRAN